jgi:hypothetical protein
MSESDKINMKRNGTRQKRECERELIGDMGVPSNLYLYLYICLEQHMLVAERNYYQSKVGSTIDFIG